MTEGYHIDDELQQRAYDSRLLSRLLHYTKPYRRYLYMAAALLLLLSLMNNLTPLFLMRAVDHYINNPARGAAMPMEPSLADEAITRDMQGLFWITAALALLMTAQALVRYFQALLVALIGQWCMYDMRIELFDHLQRQSLRFIDRNPVGRLLNRVTNDIEKIQQTIVNGVVAAVSDILTVIVVLAFMLYVNPRLAMVALSPLPFILLSSIIFRKYAQHSFLEVRRKIARITAWMQEHVSGIRTVQLFGRQNHVYVEYDHRNADHRDEWLRQVRNFAVYFPTVEFFSTLSTALILAYCGMTILRQGQEQSGLASVGTIFAFILLSERFFGPIRALADRYNLLLEAMAASERVFKLLDTDPEIRDIQQAYSVERLGGHIEFDHVWFSYNADQAAPDESTEWVLKDMNLEITPGEHVAIVGHTGAGKTTLLNLLSRFYDVQKGAIRIDGRDIREYAASGVRRQIGVVLQDPFLFSGSVRENICLGDETMTMKHVEQCARYVNAADFIHRLPGSYAYHVGERGCNLSSGQRQLISFARALAFDPAILVLDEATSSVDSETERLIQEAVEKLLQSRTSIVIAHRLSTIRNADRIVVMHRGRIRETGSHTDLISLGGLYKTLYDLQYHE